MWSLNNFKYIKTMKNFKLFKSLLVMLCMVLMGGGSVMAQKWVRCTQVSDLLSGGVFIIGYEKDAKSGVIVPMRNEATTTGTIYVRSGRTSEENNGTIDMSSITSTTDITSTKDYEIIMAPSTVVNGAVTIKIGEKFIGNENSKNNVQLFTSESKNTAFTPDLVENGNDKFTLKIDANKTYTHLQYNASSPRFAVYGGTQKNVVLYKRKVVSSVVVSGTPIKTEYQAGEKFNTEGLVVTVNYSDGSYRTADNGVTWSVTPETLTQGLTSVTVKATSDGFESAEYNVTGLTVSAAKTLTKIDVSGTPDEFWKGDAFNHNNITVTATWDDGTQTDVTSESEFSTPEDMSTAGKKTVTVTYKEKTTTYNIDVKTIANTPETAYTVNEAINLIKAGKDLDTEVYVKGIVSKVDYYNSTYKSITYWLDNNTFEVYSGRNLDNTDFSAETDIKVGAKVIIYGNIKKFGDSTYEFDKDNYLKEYTAPSELKLVAQQGENYYATFSSNKAVKFVDAEVYAVNVDGDALKLNAVESKVVPANTGVLIKTTGAKTSYYEVETSETISDNMLKASSVPMNASYKNYKLAYNDYTNKTGLGFYYGAADGGEFTAKEGGAYLAVPSSLTSARCFTFDDVETGINTIEVADEANTAAEVYDLAGRKVSKAQKGLYIVNGVKVIK